ncbi:hypothetical protein N9L20_03565 [Flavobacteriaceae bacterium]|nr:hypothetical protein [Flavobacteriaceae bacterium]
MHKKLESELISLAHRILQMKDREELPALLEKTRELYERLSLLSLIERYEQLPTTTESIEDLKQEYDYDKLMTAEASTIVKEKEIPEPNSNLDVSEPITETVETVDLGLSYDFEDFSEPVKLEETEIEVEQLVEEEPVVDLFSTTNENGQKSLNDVLFQKQLQIGLNDRIAFVKNLFKGSQEDFNRVISQLNSFQTKKEAHQFIKSNVKPDYDWSSQEELELRLFDLIDRKFS